MKKLWSQNSEARALIISTLLTVIGVGGTAFLFWFHRYDVPLAVLVGGLVVSLTWFSLYLVKKSNKPHIKIDITLIYVRLAIIAALAILFAVLAYQYKLVIVSPIYMVITYLVVSLATMVVYMKKGAGNV